jgi:hypothetical protein
MRFQLLWDGADTSAPTLSVGDGHRAICRFDLAYKRSTFYRQFAATHDDARRTLYRGSAKRDMIVRRLMYQH